MRRFEYEFVEPEETFITELNEVVLQINKLYPDYKRNFSNTNFLINKSILNFDLLKYAFHVLEIPFKETKPRKKRFKISKLTLIIGCHTDLKIIHILSLLLKIVFNDYYGIYISYSKISKNLICFLPVEVKYKYLLNISREIDLDTLLDFDFEKLNWKKLCELYPNFRYTEEGEFYDNDRDWEDQAKAKYENEFGDQPITYSDEDYFDAMTDGMLGDYR